VHVTAPFQVVKERYESRDAAAERSKSYDEVRADPTESGVWRREQEHMGAAVRLAGLHPDLKEFIGSTAGELEDAYASGKRIMLEGTQGTSLSLHHGPIRHVA
jgi:adenylosuccinate synthase